METKKIADFEFVQVGIFYRNDSPINVKFKGKMVPLHLSLDLMSDDLKKLGESAYLLFSDEELMYVGEYSFDLENRWLRDGNFVWHHKDREILTSIENNKKVTIWVTVNPYVEITKGKKINISKSIESEVLKNYDLPDLSWNRRGKLKKLVSTLEENCIKMSDFISSQ